MCGAVGPGFSRFDCSPFALHHTRGQGCSVLGLHQQDGWERLARCSGCASERFSRSNARHRCFSSPRPSAVRRSRTLDLGRPPPGHHHRWLACACFCPRARPRRESLARGRDRVSHRPRGREQLGSHGRAPVFWPARDFAPLLQGGGRCGREWGGEGGEGRGSEEGEGGGAARRPLVERDLARRIQGPHLSFEPDLPRP